MWKMFARHVVEHHVENHAESLAVQVIHKLFDSKYCEPASGWRA